MECCPHCGGTTGLEYKDYGNVLHYHEEWGTGEKEWIETTCIMPEPKIGYCEDCGRGIRLERARDKEK